MTDRVLTQLGKLASGARAAGLGGAMRLCRDVLDGACAAAGILPLGTRWEGFEVRGFLRHRGFLEHIARGGYESLYRRLFEDAIGADTMVVDGGAHIGIYSLLAARRVGSDGCVLAFEPDPQNFRALVANLKRNRCTGVIAQDKAISNAAGKIVFYQNPSTFSSSLVHRQSVGRTRAIELAATTLDAELEGRPLRSLVVKLDIEGAEPLALEGMQKTVARCEELTLLLEVNPAALRDAGFSPRALVERTNALGLTCHWIDEAARRLVPAQDMADIPKGNLYCTREKRT